MHVSNTPVHRLYRIFLLRSILAIAGWKRSGQGWVVGAFGELIMSRSKDPPPWKNEYLASGVWGYFIEIGLLRTARRQRRQDQETCDW